jgi:hypothetical protein
MAHRNDVPQQERFENSAGQVTTAKPLSSQTGHDFELPEPHEAGGFFPNSSRFIYKPESTPRGGDREE